MLGLLLSYEMVLLYSSEADYILKKTSTNRTDNATSLEL